MRGSLAHHVAGTRDDGHPRRPGLLFCSAFAMAVASLWMALSCPDGGGCLVSSTHLVIHLLLHFQREHVVCLWAQHIWANADGQIAGVHPVGLGILADVEQREQVLEQDEVWSRQFVSHPARTQTKCDVNSWCSSHYFFI